MRHILEQKQQPYTPTPSFEVHSKFFVGIITILHPIMAFFCLKTASALAVLTSDSFTSMSKIYSEDHSMDKFRFQQIAESGYLYPGYLILSIVIVASLAGMFEIFRIRSFWVNFLISALLLGVGLFIFLPTFITFN